LCAIAEVGVMSCLAKPSGNPTSASRFMNYPYLCNGKIIN
jgi:hypothetical protein